MYGCSGQRCTAVKVVLAMECIADQLVCKVNAKLAKLTIGMPEDDCDITPVVSETSANFIEGLVQDARHKGARFHQVSHDICHLFGFQQGHYKIRLRFLTFEELRSGVV
jgi:acyl-CoA reductase-like NAD-dependent aldehyde dehydrogenase